MTEYAVVMERKHLDTHPGNDWPRFQGHIGSRFWESRWLQRREELEKADRDLDKILDELRFLRSHVEEFREALEFAKDLRHKMEEGKLVLVESGSLSPAEAFEFSQPPGTTKEDFEKAKAMILEELDRVPGFYPSDFAKSHDLNLGLVLRAFKELEQEGEIILSPPPQE